MSRLIFYDLTINANNINNAIVTLEDASKIWKFCVLQNTFFSLKFVEIVFISSSYEFITSSEIKA